MVGFILRVVFWLGLVIVLLPGEDGVTAAENALRRLSDEGADAGQLLALCARQPDICAALAGIARDNAAVPDKPRD